MRKYILFIFILFLGLIIFSPVFAQEISDYSETCPHCVQEDSDKNLQINFFYSETCLHCKAEHKFLDEIEEKYPDVKINRHPVSQAHCREILIDLCRKYNLENYIGLVPITFVGEEFFLGFDDPEGIGKQIEESIQRQLEEQKSEPQDKNKITLPIIGEIDLTKYSLPVQAVVLGFFDGFNVCSLGALILILGLVLVLRSRAKIFIFGGVFILITAIVYGLLIVFWYQLFYFLAPALKMMNIFVGVLGILGGIYFFKQFIKYKKYGPTCDIDTGRGVVGKFSKRLQDNFKKSGGILGIIISIFVFAVVITVVEFPCSAVIPVFFASALAQAQLPTLIYLLYIAIFVFFYMLDEIVIFLIALFTMTIKIASSRAIIWITLLESIILFGLGFYYLFGF
jgi:thiol-disulfide isomerase/thioredoxin